MGSVLRLAIVDPDDGTRASLKSMLLGMDVVWLEAECSRYEFFGDVVAQTEPDVGVVVLDHDPEKGLQLIRSIREMAPKCSVLVVSGANDGQLILAAMRSGAQEFLTLPLSVGDFVGAFERIGQQLFGANAGRTSGCVVVAIAGAGGGVGSTSLAVNLGCMIAQNANDSIALVDLDLSLGDADVFLDTIPDYTLSDVAQNVSRLDFTLLKRSLTKHFSGLYLLPRPIQLQDTALVSPDDFTRVMGLLKATFSHVILDLSKSYSPLDMAAMEEAERVLLVTQLDLPCLRNVVRLMMSFGEIEGLKEKTQIVVNRVGLDSGQISLKKAQETIGGEVYWQIPNDFRTMVEVRNNGVPLMEQAPKASITQSVAGLAAAITGVTAIAEQSEKSGLGRLLGFLPNRGKVAEKKT